MSNKTFSIIGGRLRITYPGYTGPDQYDLPCDETLELTEAETIQLYKMMRLMDIDHRFVTVIQDGDKS